MTCILLFALCAFDYSVFTPVDYSVIDPPAVKPAPTQRPDPPPPAPELSGCEGGQCQPRRMVWRRRR